MDKCTHNDIKRHIAYLKVAIKACLPRTSIQHQIPHLGVSRINARGSNKWNIRHKSCDGAISEAIAECDESRTMKSAMFHKSPNPALWLDLSRREVSWKLRVA